MTPFLEAMTAISVALATLKATTGINPEILNYIQIADDAVTQAMAAYQKAQQAVDPTALKPIDQV